MIGLLLTPIIAGLIFGWKVFAVIVLLDLVYFSFALIAALSGDKR